MPDNIASFWWLAVLWCIGRFIISSHLVHAPRRASCHLRSGGGMLYSNGNHFVGVDLIVPEVNFIAVFSWTPILFVWALFCYTGTQYSAAEYIKAIVKVQSVFISPHKEMLARFWMILCLV